MNERDPTTDGVPPPPLDDDTIGRLIEDAGRRPSIPREDLDAIAASARAAWERRQRAAGSRASATATEARGEPRRRVRSLAASLALAAALASLILGLRLVWRLSRDDVPMPAPARVATLVSGSASSRVETGGIERALAVGENVVAGTTLEVGADRAALLLENGITIRLDAGSVARVDSNARIDLFDGAIYADTDPDGDTGGPDRVERRALEVHTAAGVARDVGTRFAARLIGTKQEPSLEVLVRSGAVSVERAGASKVAGPGEQIVTSDAGMQISPAATYGPEWAWILDAAPPFEVAGRSIADLLDWVARETGWTVRYEEPGLEQDARTMVLQASRSQGGALRADQAPFVLLPSANLSGDLEQGVLTVRRR